MLIKFAKVTKERCVLHFFAEIERRKLIRFAFMTRYFRTVNCFQLTNIVW